MKSKITRKLILYFLLIILLFSLVSGGLFFILGKRSLEEASANSLIDRVQRLSGFITQIIDNSVDRMGMMPEGHGMMQGKMMHSPGRMYLKWMNELLEADIRIVEKEGRSIEAGIDKKPIDFASLNESEQKIVEAAFLGEVTWTKDSTIFSEQTSVTVAAPILSNDEVISVVLLNEEKSLSREFLDSAKVIFLISTVAGVLLVAALAVFFANRFIGPLEKINQTTKMMAEGDYRVRSGVKQNDEIGDLALAVDSLALRLEEARAESEAMNQMKDDFISSMSHELKTPVTVLKSSLEALHLGVVSEEKEVKEYHKILFDEVGVLERLINDLMDLNVLKNKKFELKKEEINIIEVLNDAVRSQTPLARQKGMQIDKNYQENVVMLLADYTRLRQLFITIVNNGIKYADKNSVLKVEEFSKDDKKIIAIRNQGEKIPDHVKEHIFEAFYRDKNTEVKGFGLGLAIAKEIANLHDIKISVEDDENWTSFLLELPIN